MMAKEPEDWNWEEAGMVSQTEGKARMQVPFKAWDLVLCSGPTPHVWPRGPQGVNAACLPWGVP